jgi:hypothetical protein
MITTNDAVSRLQKKREDLLTQLAAVDQALARLGVLGLKIALPEKSQETSDEAASAVVPMKVKPAKMLSDDHKHALNEGRRKARHAKDAAAGVAREMPDPVPGLAPSSVDGRRPRLVKRTRRSPGASVSSSQT